MGEGAAGAAHKLSPCKANTVMGGWGALPKILRSYKDNRELWRGRM